MIFFQWLKVILLILALYMTFILFRCRLFKAGLPIYVSTVTVNIIGDIWPFNFRKKFYKNSSKDAFCLVWDAAELKALLMRENSWESNTVLVTFPPSEGSSSLM